MRIWTNDSFERYERFRDLIDIKYLSITWNIKNKIRYGTSWEKRISMKQRRLSIVTESIHDFRRLDVRNIWKEDALDHESRDSGVCLIYFRRSDARFKYDIMGKEQWLIQLTSAARAKTFRISMVYCRIIVFYYRDWYFKINMWLILEFFNVDCCPVRSTSVW